MKYLLFFSKALVPLVLFYMIGFGLLQKRPVLDDFLDGAKEGIRTTIKVMPTLIGLMTAVGVLRASGFLDFLGELLAEPARLIHLPAPIVPVALVRLVSNAAATGLVLDIFKTSGPDSAEGMIGSILMSSTETVFYCLSVYFGAAHITKTRFALKGALVATAAGVIASILIGTAAAS
ncbi:MAG: spore maturation protein [Lachnospiraceae bacterium]